MTRHFCRCLDDYKEEENDYMDDIQVQGEQQTQLPPVQLYAIGPREVTQVAPLLTAEAAALIGSDEAFGLAIVEEGEARGAVCARLAPENDICLELLSLFVAPQYRRRQLGSTLLLELLETCEEMFDGSVARVEAAFSPEEGLEALLKKAGFHLEQDEAGACSHFIPVAKLAACPLMKQKAHLPKGGALLSFEQLSPLRIRQLFGVLKNTETDYMDLEGLYQALPDASFLLLDEREHPAACAVFTGKDERLCLSQFYIAGGNAVNAIVVLKAAAEALLKQYPDACLELPLLAPSLVRLTEKLLGDESDSRPLIRAVFEL